MSSRAYQMCVRCIMDTTDPEIEFDKDGLCNHCRAYEKRAQQTILPEVEREKALEQLVAEIKSKGKGKEYDCIVGVSGGVDSSYTAYVIKKLGLRPLAVHLDNGWNSELAVSNIEKQLKILGIDLYTFVLDWQEFKDLQTAFLKASVSDAEIPTDHAILATLYRVASERDINHIIIGTNLVTEGILPGSWTYGVGDWRYIKSVHSKFGESKLTSYPHYSYLNFLYYNIAKRMSFVYFLDYIPYNKQEAIQVLKDELGWTPYGGKHYESIYTRFFQGYILPRKFNIDKRKAHLSTLIMSNQMTREEALAEMELPPYAGSLIEEDFEYVLKKLELSEDEFSKIMSSPIKTHKDYPTLELIFNLMRDLPLGRLARTVGLLPAR
ncbi:MAG: N-acetyl sugar amidotransferase [Ardenticatenaceae bacterium]